MISYFRLAQVVTFCVQQTFKAIIQYGIGFILAVRGSFHFHDKVIYYTKGDGWSLLLL